MSLYQACQGYFAVQRACNAISMKQKSVSSVRAVQATNGSFFPAAVVSLYCAYLGYSALQSEPHDYECNSLGHRLSAASGSTLALGMVSTPVL